MAMTTQQLTQFVEEFLNYIGAPAAGAQDPRVKFLVAMGEHENTDATNNPFAITNPEGQPASALSGNTTGVQQFATPQEGMAAFRAYLINQHVNGLFAALHNPNVTIPQLTDALSQANWEGSATPAAQEASKQYAETIGNMASGATSSVGTAAAPAPGNPFSVAKSGGTFLPSNFEAQMGDVYTGPGAYKGFDLQAIPPSLRQQARNAIDYYTANPQVLRNMLESIYQSYGNMAWAATDPQIRTILVAGTYNNWQADKGLTQSLYADTKLYKTHDASQRNWMQIQANDPAEAQNAIRQAAANITDIATKMGVPLTAQQVQSMAEQVAPLSVNVAGSFANTTESTQQIYQMVRAQFSANSFLGQLGANANPSGAPQPIGANGTVEGVAASGSMPGGTAAELYNAFQNIARNYYIDLSPQQITQYVQQYLRTDAGPGFDPATATSGFTSLMQTQARQKYPTLAGIIGTTDTSTGNNITPYSATQWIRNMIAQYTGLGSEQDVNLNDAQWSWILSGTGAPTSRAAGIMSPSASGNGNSASSASGQLPSADQLQSYLMGTPQFQTTHLAKQMAWNVGDQILKSFGYSG